MAIGTLSWGAGLAYSRSSKPQPLDSTDGMPLEHLPQPNSDLPSAPTGLAAFRREWRRQWRVLRAWLRRSLEGQAVGRLLGLSRAPVPSTGDAGDGVKLELGAPRERMPSPTPALPFDDLRAAFEARRQAREDRRQNHRAEAEEEPLPETPVLPVETEPAPVAEPVAPEPVPVVDPPAVEAVPAPSAFDPSAPYPAPPDELLSVGTEVVEHDPAEIEQQQNTIQATIDSFGIDAEVGHATPGPRVTLFEVNVARGVKVEAVARIANNLAMDLSAVSLRILAPVPGHDYVGIEVPNRHAETVRLGDLLRGDLWQRTRATLPLLVGRDIRGADVILDLAKAPHLLVAGATGSGKSVCLNSMLMSLVYRHSPEELQLLLIDPKVVEFAVYNQLPHLIAPVVNDVAVVVLALHWLITEMERRYRLLAKVGARSLASFNSRPPSPEPILDDAGDPIPDRLPHIVVIIDELADIMMTARQDVEQSLARIAQMSRAVGIHTIIATQRPSVNVITGIIKANYPTRIAFQVASQFDSRTIIDGKGAESLLGQGDMLFQAPGAARLERLQGALVEDGEIEGVVRHVASWRPADFDTELFASAAVGNDQDAVEFGSTAEDADEPLIQQAIESIVRDRRASTSYIQRRLRIGYNRAASIMEILEERGIVGPQIGSSRREILVDAEGSSDEWALPDSPSGEDQ
jgi:DNA segregation ATPase FtsK/SpoIIIE, S-DNA-T family